MAVFELETRVNPIISSIEEGGVKEPQVVFDFEQEIRSVIKSMIDMARLPTHTGRVKGMQVAPGVNSTPSPGKSRTEAVVKILRVFLIKNLADNMAQMGQMLPFHAWELDGQLYRPNGTPIEYQTSPVLHICLKGEGRYTLEI